jgi:acetyl-CoA C-acetyltransferase
MSDPTIVLLDGARTPVGSFGGVFRDVAAHELGGIAASAALERAGVDGGDVAEVVMGCIGQVGGDAYLARRVALAAGLPVRTPAFTVNGCAAPGCRRSGPRRWRCGGTTSTSPLPAAPSR